MASCRRHPAPAVIEAVEVLARYASTHGIAGAEEVLMEILAAAHGWPVAGPVPVREDACAGDYELASLPPREYGYNA